MADEPPPLIIDFASIFDLVIIQPTALPTPCGPIDPNSVQLIALTDRRQTLSALTNRQPIWWHDGFCLEGSRTLFLRAEKIAPARRCAPGRAFLALSVAPGLIDERHEKRDYGY